MSCQAVQKTFISFGCGALVAVLFNHSMTTAVSGIGWLLAAMALATVRPKQ